MPVRVLVEGGAARELARESVRESQFEPVKEPVHDRGQERKQAAGPLPHDAEEGQVVGRARSASGSGSGLQGSQPSLPGMPCPSAPSASSPVPSGPAPNWSPIRPSACPATSDAETGSQSLEGSTGTIVGVCEPKGLAWESLQACAALYTPQSSSPIFPSESSVQRRPWS